MSSNKGGSTFRRMGLSCQAQCLTQSTFNLGPAQTLFFQTEVDQLHPYCACCVTESGGERESWYVYSSSSVLPCSVWSVWCGVLTVLCSFPVTHLPSSQL